MLLSNWATHSEFQQEPVAESIYDLAFPKGFLTETVNEAKEITLKAFRKVYPLTDKQIGKWEKIKHSNRVTEYRCSVDTEYGEDTLVLVVRKI